MNAFVKSLAWRLLPPLPLKRNRVVLTTFQGTYCCNPKYVTEELIKVPGLDVVWLVSRKAKPKDFPKGVRLVRNGTLASVIALKTAKVWCENGLMLVKGGEVRKRKDQFYFQPLHGSLGIKKQGLRGPEVRERADRLTDFCISNSAFETDVYRTSYWPTTEVLEYGHPRNDIMFAPDEVKERIRRKVRKTLKLTGDEKLALYAPTFRPDGDVDAMCIDCEGLAKALSGRFGGGWRVLLRMHPHDVKKMRGRLPPGCVDAGNYPDMQELMLACDVGITDYSSWIFDFILGGGYGFIYATDVAKYSDAVGMYYPLESTPFPVSSDEAGLHAAIAAFDPEVYAVRVKDFLASKGCVEDGKASVRVVRKMLEYLEPKGE